MSLVITPQIELMVKAIISTGNYTNETEVLEEGLRLVQQRERLREEMQVAIDQANRGELLDEDEFFRQLEEYADKLDPPAR